MEPLSPQDPLHTLLGKARPVEPRGDFTQNVMRAVRQMPQHVGLWERVQQWVAEMVFPRSFVVAAVSVALSLGVFVFWKPMLRQVISAPVVAVATEVSFDFTKPSESDVASELDGMNHLSALLAQQDTSTLSDSDIAFLLY